MAGRNKSSGKAAGNFGSSGGNVVKAKSLEGGKSAESVKRAKGDKSGESVKRAKGGKSMMGVKSTESGAAVENGRRVKSSPGARNARDVAEKSLESYGDVHADLMNVLLFGGKRIVSEHDLEQALPRSAYDGSGGIREQERDCAKYWKGLGVRLAYIGLENETESEANMPIRVMGYDGAAYRDQLYYMRDESGARRLNDKPRFPVVTLVLYFDYTKRWDKPVTLLGTLGQLPKELEPYVNDYRMNLFEIAFLTDEQVEMFRSDFRIIADYFVQMRKTGEYVPSKIPFVHGREVLRLMRVLTKDDRFEEAYNDWGKEKEEAKHMCEVLDRVENRGWERGRSEGLRDGERKGRHEGERKGERKGRRETLVSSVENVMKNLGLALKEACMAVGTTEEAYFKAKKNIK